MQIKRCNLDSAEGHDMTTMTQVTEFANAKLAYSILRRLGPRVTYHVN